MLGTAYTRGNLQMIINNNRQNAHAMIDHIFHDLLPAQGMTERPEQTALSHLMLNALLDGSIALCDAGTVIGKTYGGSGLSPILYRRWTGISPHHHFHLKHRPSKRRPDMPTLTCSWRMPSIEVWAEILSCRMLAPLSSTRLTNCWMPPARCSVPPWMRGISAV